MSVRLTDEQLHRYIQQPLGCGHKEAIQIILALRARVAQLEATLHGLRSNVDYHGHKKIDAALKDTPQ